MEIAKYKNRGNIKLLVKNQKGEQMPNLGKVDYLFIVNQKVPKENVLEINQHFHGRNLCFIYTESWEEAVIKIATLDARKSFKTAVAVGGDGTVNAVVNGLMKHQNSKTFGVIPAGTGNDFAKSLRLPKTIAENCRLILSTEPKKIDIGKISVSKNESLYFANIASIGIDALATKLSANQSPIWKKIHPMLHYAAGLFKAILRYKPADFKIIGKYFLPQPEIEEGLKKKILLAVFANGGIYGGNFPIAPTAKINDGNLTLCVIEAMPFWKTLRNLPKLLAAKHGELKEVLFADFKGIIVASDSGLLQIDGEVIQTKQLAENLYLYDIRAVPSALRVVKGSRGKEIIFSAAKSPKKINSLGSFGAK